jgi:hypothetical protein
MVENDSTMQLDAPFTGLFTLGAFSVDQHGRLLPRVPEMPPGFGFRWRMRDVRARLVSATGAPRGRLLLQATLGRVPSTALDGADELRPQSFAVVRALNRALPSDWRVRLLADHSVLLETSAAVGLPVTATSLLTEITRFLLELDPYLDLLDEVGLTASDPVAGEPSVGVLGGSASTCPG